MTDKIIQITDTLTDEGDGQTLGLGESGTLYRLIEKGHHQDQDVDGRIKSIYVLDSRKWEIYIESPDKE